MPAVRSFFRGRPMIPTSVRALLFGTLLSLTSLAPLAAAVVPAGFTETRIASGLDPTGLAFLPDGRLLVSEKAGRLRLVDGHGLASQPLLDLSDRIDNNEERGLLGIAVDPAFATNGHVYLYHTLKPAGQATASHNRVSRFTLAGETVSPASETVILDLPDLGRAGYHNGGGLVFGLDGKLYISVGENTVGPRAQALDNLFGKLLRLNPDGTRPTDNPFFAPGDPVRSAIYCLGLRNPFGLAVQPGTGRIFIDDVGAGVAEEINDAVPGANFGWPLVEGRRTNQKVPDGYRDPLHAYDHGGAIAICGGTFYDPAKPGPEAFPAAWKGRYLFADYTTWIAWIDPAAPQIRHPFLTAINRPLALAVAPDGALWYLERAGTPGGSPAANRASANGALYRVIASGAPPGPAHHLVYTQVPVTARVAAPFTNPVELRIVDQAGNQADVALPVEITLGGRSDQKLLAGTTRVTSRHGFVSFTDLRIDRPAHGFVLVASAPGLVPATSGGISVNGGVVAPTIAPAPGTYTGPVTVTLATPTVDAEIHYTLDGRDPEATSPKADRPFVVSATTTVKAVAMREGLGVSGITKAVLTIAGSTPYGLPVRPPVRGLALPAHPEDAPPTLSATGLFADLERLVPAPGVVPYTVNSPLWSDRAEKLRWVALPPEGRIDFSATGEWTWPAGTVFIKHFDLPVDADPHSLRRRLETRVLVFQPSGGETYGITYRWRADRRDADLVPADGADEDVPRAAGTQAWHYPSRSQCLQCHTTNAGSVLGPRTRQLNGEYAYPGGATDNQLRTWSYLGMFRKPIPDEEIPRFDRLVSIHDTAAPVEHRVRSYLDANCASCHRPGGTPAAWDARYDTPLAQQGIVGSPVRDGMGRTDLLVVAPGHRDRSSLFLRLVAPDAPLRMPTLGRAVIHQEAVDLIGGWIDGLPPAKIGAAAPVQR